MLNLDQNPDKLLQLFTSLASYLISPQSSPNPFSRLWRLDEKVLFNPISLKFCENHKNDGFSPNGRTPSELQRFLGVLAVLKEVMRARNEGRCVKKRELYYEWVELFEDQEQVDYIISKICYVCGSRRKELGIVKFFIN